MSRLTLIRHGQASFMTDDYDRLSPLGQRQCRYLGDYWASHGVRVDRLAVGRLRRHRQSAEAFAAGYAASGGALPAIEELPGLDEFPWDGMLAYAALELLERHAHLRPLQHALAEALERESKRRAFQRYMEAVTLLWAQDAFRHGSVEPYGAFAARVNAAIDTLIAGAAGGAHVAAFTSGGPAAVAAQRALGFAPDKTLELIWTLRNGACVEFLFTPERFSLSAFNNAAHLATPDLWTYR